MALLLTSLEKKFMNAFTTLGPIASSPCQVLVGASPLPEKIGNVLLSVCRDVCASGLGGGMDCFRPLRTANRAPRVAGEDFVDKAMLRKRRSNRPSLLNAAQGRCSGGATHASGKK